MSAPVTCVTVMSSELGRSVSSPADVGTTAGDDSVMSVARLFTAVFSLGAAVCPAVDKVVMATRRGAAGRHVCPVLSAGRPLTTLLWAVATMSSAAADDDISSVYKCHTWHYVVDSWLVIDSNDLPHCEHGRTSYFLHSSRTSMNFRKPNFCWTEDIVNVTW